MGSCGTLGVMAACDGSCELVKLEDLTKQALAQEASIIGGTQLVSTWLDGACGALKNASNSSKGDCDGRLAEELGKASG